MGKDMEVAHAGERLDLSKYDILAFDMDMTLARYVFDATYFPPLELLFRTHCHFFSSLVPGINLSPCMNSSLCSWSSR